MISISDIKKLYPESIPFIAKIDIEGFEHELFSKKTDWIKDFYPITLEIHDWMMTKNLLVKTFSVSILKKVVIVILGVI